MGLMWRECGEIAEKVITGREANDGIPELFVGTVCVFGGSGWSDTTSLGAEELLVPLCL